ncbi:hypothetical protein ANABIO32_12640 [Rossellomorea marisflavi]|nr:hypothetical protein ANABIO32_12640 [Rossellomorea marisflavi]
MMELMDDVVATIPSNPRVAVIIISPLFNYFYPFPYELKTLALAVRKASGSLKERLTVK